MADFDIGRLVGTLLLQDKATGVLKAFDSQLGKSGKEFQKLGREMTSGGIAITKAITLPIIAIGGLSVKFAKDFEDSFTGVRKTVDASEEDFSRLSDSFRQMSKEIPVNINEINKLGESAGQLGIKTENIVLFSRTMADLGVTTNLSSEIAASSLAKLANITGLPQTEFDRLGSSVVDLGNKFATTEADIVAFGLRIAGAGELAGLSEADILGIGSAMTSVGVQAEAGGTAVQKVLLNMSKAVEQGGIKLIDFASTAGLSASQFKRAFEQDAAGAFTSFVEGLGRAGNKAFTILDDLNLKDQRLIRSFLSLANAGDLLRESIEVSNVAFRENTALTEEAEKRYATFSSKITITVNKLKDVGITLGNEIIPIISNTLIPVLESTIKTLSVLVKRFSELSTPMQNLVLGTIALVAAGGPLLIVIGLITTAIGSIQIAVAGLTAVLAVNPLVLPFVALAAAVVAADVATSIWKGKTEKAMKAITKESDRMRKSFMSYQKAIRSKDISDLNKQLAIAKERYANVFGSITRVNKEIRDLGEKSILTNSIAHEILNRELAVYQAELEGTFVNIRKMEKALETANKTVKESGDEWSDLSDEVEESGKRLKPIIDLSSKYARAVERMTDANKKSAAQLKIDGIVRLREWGLEIENLPGSFDSLVVSIRELNKEAESDSLSKFVGEGIQEIIIDIGRAEAERLEIYRQMNELDLSLELREQVFAAMGIKQESLEILTIWDKLGITLSSVFSGMEGDVGKIGRSFEGIVKSIKQISGGKGSEGFGTGLVGLAQGISDLGEAVGLFDFKGPQGTSKFGGTTEGDESVRGAQAGQAIGAVIGAAFFGVGAVVGAAVGKVLGKIVGSFIKHGADTAEATVTQVANEIRTRVTKEEGPLGKPIRLIGKMVADAFDSLEDIIGGQIGIADFRIKIREDVITAWVNGVKAKFETIGEAVEFIVLEALSTAEFGEEVSGRFRTALENASIASVEELQELLAIVAKIESIASETGVVGEAFKVLGIEMKAFERTIIDAGLDAADAVLVQAFKVGQIRKAITDALEGIIGVADVAGGLQDLIKSADEFNTGIDAITEARNAELQAVIDSQAVIADLGDVLNLTAGTVGGLTDDLLLGEDGMDRFKGGLGRAGAGLKKVVFDVDTFAAAIEKLPERIDIRELQDAATVAASGVAVTLIDMIQAVRGSGVLAAEKQRQQEATFKIQLAAQIVQLVALSQMTELFSAIAIAGFQGIINEALGLLDDLNTGAASIGDQAQKASSGRNKARKAAEEEFNKSAERVQAVLLGATEASFNFADTIRVIRDQAKEARIPLEEIERAIGNLAELDIRGITAEWSDAVDTISRSNLGNAVADIVSRAQVAIDEINARAEENQSAAAQGLAIVSAGVQAEMQELGKNTLLALSGPITQLRAETNATIRDIKFMVRNVDDLGLTLVQVANKVREGIIPGLIEIGIREAERLGLSEKAADFRAIQQELELKFQLIQLLGMRQMLIAAGAFDEATQTLFDDVFELFNMGRDLPPLPPIDTGDTEESLGDIEDNFDEAADTIVIASTRISDTFVILAENFDRINRRFTRLSTNTAILTSDIAMLSPVTFRATKRISELTDELRRLSNVGSVSPQTGFATGSSGFIDFGSGSLQALHGEEQIVTRAESSSIAAMVEGAIRSGSGGSRVVETLLNGFSMLEIGQEKEEVDRIETRALIEELIRRLGSREGRDRTGRPNVEEGF